MQDTRAAGRLVMAVGEKAIEMIRDMERVTSISGATFRAVEPVIVPEDLRKVVDLMDPVNGKPTATRLRAVAADVAESRWWKWHLLHPLMPEGVIHKSRRMHLSTCPALPVFCSVLSNF